MCIRDRYEGYAVHTGVVHQACPEGPVEQPCAYRSVAVYVRAYRLQGVVEVHAREISQPDHLLELAPRAVVCLGCRHVISRRVGVTGVNAYPHAALVLDTVYDTGYLLEGISEVAPLSGRVLDDGLDTCCLVEYHVERLGYQVEAPVGLNLAHVAAGMEIQHRQP